MTEDLTFTIVSNDDDTIYQKIKECLDALRCEGNIICSDAQTREKANSNHCSVGKYMAYEELSKYDADLTLEECMNMKMNEIHEQIDNHRMHHSNEINTENGYKDGHHSNHH